MGDTDQDFGKELPWDTENKIIFDFIGKNNKVFVGYKSMGVDMLFDVSPEFADFLVKHKKEGAKAPSLLRNRTLKQLSVVLDNILTELARFSVSKNGSLLCFRNDIESCVCGQFRQNTELNGS